MTAYKVIAPYVTLTVDDENGNPTLLGFYEDQVVSNASDDEQVQRHLRKGLIEKASSGSSAQADSDEGPPAKSASKADWVEYAVSQGMSADEAESTTRDDLAAQYSG